MKKSLVLPMRNYKDVLDYIISINGCSYYFNYLPLQKIGLPIPNDKNN